MNKSFLTSLGVILTAGTLTLGGCDGGSVALDTDGDTDTDTDGSGSDASDSASNSNSASDSNSNSGANSDSDSDSTSSAGTSTTAAGTDDSTTGGEASGSTGEGTTGGDDTGSTGGSGEDSTGGEESTGPAVDPCMGIEFQQCFMTEGCTWEPMGIGMGECVTGGGGAEGGGVCEFVPVAFCDATPGCMVDGDECVEG